MNNLNMKSMLLATLLILVFITSTSIVFAENAQDSEKLTIDDADETITASENPEKTLAISEDDDETLAVPESEETLVASSSDSTSDSDSSKSPKLTVDIEVLDKNIKVGDKFRVKVTIKNVRNARANSVVSGVGVTDLLENPDATIKLLDAGLYNVQDTETGWEIYIDYIDPGVTHEVLLTFEATESGKKIMGADVVSDESEGHQDDTDNTIISIGESSDSDDVKINAHAGKTMHATGNPLALLALSLFCIIPYYRRK